MTVRRAAILLIGTSVAALAAVAQTTLPDGLTQLGNVIMMEPIADRLDRQRPGIDRERRPSAMHVLSAGDHDVYSRAFDAADRGDWTAARGLAAQGHDAIATRLITWRYVLDKNSGASFSDIDGFLRNNPDWPLRDTIFARAEVAMDPGMTPAAVIAWFGSRAPVTGIGMIRLGDAMIATGKPQAGREMIQRGWISGSFQPDQELAIVRKDGGLLTPDIDRARLSNLISIDDATAARREISRVEEDVQKLGEAGWPFEPAEQRASGSSHACPPRSRSDPELLFDRARAARRANDNEAAAIFLGRGTLRHFVHAHPARWWVEANLVTRALLQSGDDRAAYGVVSDTGLTNGSEFDESEFMAGWIALRFLEVAEPGAQPLQPA